LRLGRAHIPRSRSAFLSCELLAARRCGEPALTHRTDPYDSNDDPLNGGRRGAPTNFYATIPRPAGAPAQVCCGYACVCFVCCCSAVSLAVACGEAMCVCF